MLKILFAGTPDVAVPSLRALASDSEHFEVVAVLHPPGRAHRTRTQAHAQPGQDCRAGTGIAGTGIRPGRADVP